jgi:glycosyltransferase involved in cell wall biosynthesis
MIAIILVNFNSISILHLINFMLKQLINEKDVVIYLVDNGSTDNSNLIILNYLSDLAIPYRYFHLPYNLGFVRAVNLAFRKLDDVKYRLVDVLVDVLGWWFCWGAGYYYAVVEAVACG